MLYSLYGVQVEQTVRSLSDATLVPVALLHPFTASEFVRASRCVFSTEGLKRRRERGGRAGGEILSSRRPLMYSVHRQKTDARRSSSKNVVTSPTVDHWQPITSKSGPKTK